MSTTTPDGHSFAEVLAEWQKGKKPDAIAKTRRALAMVEAAGVTAPIERLGRQDGLAVRAHINDTMESASGKTRSDLLACVQALLNFAVKEKGWIESNPWAGTAIAKGRAKKREPWADEDLASLLASPLFQSYALDADPKGGCDAQYWVPLLAMMTGARQAELWQLRVSDVIERDGICLIDINENTEGKSVKSAAGIRKVAVHSKLLALGFGDYVANMREAGHTLLFLNRPGIRGG